MKIVFYCCENANVNSMNFSKVPCSGTASGVICISDGLARLGHDVIVMNGSDSCVCGGVRYINISSHAQCMSAMRTIENVDIFIANNMAGEIYHTFRVNARKKIFWLHNYIDITPYEKDIREGRLDYIYCVSLNHMGAYWLSKHFSRFHFIYNPLNCLLFPEYDANKKRKNKIMFVGALRKCKGFHDAIRIWSKFSTLHPEYELYVAGAVDLHKADDARIVKGLYEHSKSDDIDCAIFDKTGAVKKNIVFLGKIGRSELFKHFSTTKICLQNPSWDDQPETFCVAAAEAQAMGVPVVSVYRGGLARGCD